MRVRSIRHAPTFYHPRKRLGPPSTEDWVGPKAGLD